MKLPRSKSNRPARDKKFRKLGRVKSRFRLMRGRFRAGRLNDGKLIAGKPTVGKPKVPRSIPGTVKSTFGRWMSGSKGTLRSMYGNSASVKSIPVKFKFNPIPERLKVN